ncbi:hypothetical protein [Alkalihalobacterium sp. APHAB7]|uniref:hypothetical protein n=1 Tax=Alkalihalobacterium sp. APHAB7 TaxID=3402081 RepID=UPI003AAA64D6
MIAEVKGKISRLGSNLSERLEDNLTGNVLGAFRYMPFSSGIGEILANGVYPKSVGETIGKIQCEFWADQIQFWPYDREGEIDVLIEFEEAIIGIELKYTSGLSSDDDISNSENSESDKKIELRKSINQLARESRIISQKGRQKKKLLLLIADRSACKNIYEDVIERNILEADVAFAYISWQEILIQLKKLPISEPYYQVIINDVMTLLKRKGFEDFTNMQIDVPQPIDHNVYFQFNRKKEIYITFKTKQIINGGSYYEFS